MAYLGRKAVAGSMFQVSGYKFQVSGIFAIFTSFLRESPVT
jgi:hypothetical protein